MGSFYRGDLDDQVVTAPNGAKANRSYLAFADAAKATEELRVVRPGVWTLTRYSLSNYTFVETDNGVIGFDTGGNIGMGRHALARLREVTDKPIVAVVYSHHHYTGGAAAYVDGRDDIPVYGHPDVDTHLRSSSVLLGPMQNRRTGIQLGVYLPLEGPDASLTPTSVNRFADPEENRHGHRPVTHPVADGEAVTIDGVRVVFHHVVSDSSDSLIMHVPDLDLALHNAAVTPVAFPLYTLRGDVYRPPKELIAGIDILRGLRPTYTVGCHGEPLTTVEEGYEAATAHRDLYAFIYNQSIRAINKGLSPDDMVAKIRVPDHLDGHPWLFPGYVDHEYAIRAQYRGIVGWYAEDTADLHPPAPSELGQVIVEGFGGEDVVVERARSAFLAKQYNLAAKLLSFVLAVAPTNVVARHLKADALRAMAYSTRSGIQTRNFLLTHAGHLDGSIDWLAKPRLSFFGERSTEAILAAPPDAYVRVLETAIDPDASATVQRTARITLSDLHRSWTLHIRRGVAEVTERRTEDVDVAITLASTTWARIVAREVTLMAALAADEADLDGAPAILDEILGCFDTA